MCHGGLLPFQLEIRHHSVAGMGEAQHPPDQPMSHELRDLEAPMRMQAGDSLQQHE